MGPGYSEYRGPGPKYSEYSGPNLTAPKMSPIKRGSGYGYASEIGASPATATSILEVAISRPLNHWLVFVLQRRIGKAKKNIVSFLVTWLEKVGEGWGGGRGFLFFS